MRMGVLGEVLFWFVIAQTPHRRLPPEPGT